MNAAAPAFRPSAYGATRRFPLDSAHNSGNKNA